MNYLALVLGAIICAKCGRLDCADRHEPVVLCSEMVGKTDV